MTFENNNVCELLNKESVLNCMNKNCYVKHLCVVQIETYESSHRMAQPKCKCRCKSHKKVIKQHSIYDSQGIHKSSFIVKSRISYADCVKYGKKTLPKTKPQNKNNVKVMKHPSTNPTKTTYNLKEFSVIPIQTFLKQTKSSKSKENYFIHKTLCIPSTRCIVKSSNSHTILKNRFEVLNSSSVENTLEETEGTICTNVHNVHSKLNSTANQMSSRNATHSDDMVNKNRTWKSLLNDDIPLHIRGSTPINRGTTLINMNLEAKKRVNLLINRGNSITKRGTHPNNKNSRLHTMHNLSNNKEVPLIKDTPLKDRGTPPTSRVTPNITIRNTLNNRSTVIDDRTTLSINRVTPTDNRGTPPNNRGTPQANMAQQMINRGTTLNIGAIQNNRNSTPIYKDTSPNTIQLITTPPSTTQRNNTNQHEQRRQKVGNKIKVLYTNSDQLPNKVHELLINIGIFKPDVIMITEVLPKNSNTKTTKASMEINGFELYTNIEVEENIRGISLYVSSNLTVEETKFNTISKENIWCTLKLKDKDKLLLGCIYRSPSNNNENTHSLCNLLQEINDTNPSHILITGDFNYPEIDWSDYHSNTSNDHRSQIFLNKIQDMFLYQHVTEFTRYREGQNPNLLDLILTNEEGMVNDIQYVPPLGKSDHVCLVFNTNLYAETKVNNKPKYAYHRGNYQKINTNLKLIDWENRLENINTEHSWTLFEEVMSQEMEENIPKSRTKKRKPYINKQAEKKMKKKYYLWKRFKETNLGRDHEEYKKERNSLRDLTRKLQKEFEKDLIKKLNKDPKAFWRYANSKIKTRSKISHLTKEDGSLTQTYEEQAQVLNMFFSSVFTEEDLSQIPILENRQENDPMANIHITPEMVLKKLKALKNTKSAGPDKIHPRILKETAEVICVPLSMIFNKSIQEGHVPQGWKDAHVTALHKKGNKSNPGNYRPISLTAVCGKIMESLIRDNIVTYMLENGLFADQQHGFVPNRSCITQLLCVMEDWTKWLDSGNCIDSIFLDFQKAFDSVPHERLLAKLEAYGIIGETASWIRSFLKNRRQKVVVENGKSDWVNVISGIPQGSVLGPTLFVIFINDLPDVVTSTIQIFADDTKIYRTVNDIGDTTYLQEDLHKLQLWSTKWQLNFNAKKCKVMHLGHRNANVEYAMNGTTLDIVTEEKDLGVIIDKELKFHKHVSASVSKANQILGIVKRTFETLDIELLPLVYKCQVRPHLEYGNAIWHPRYVADIKKVESVQRRATKIIPELRDKPYQERLQSLKLYSMEYRRKRGDMIQTYKILKKTDRIDSIKFFTQSNYKGTRNHSMKLFKPRFESELRKHAFSQRVIDDWNSLTENIVISESLSIFKGRLDKHWKTKWYKISTE